MYAHEDLARLDRWLGSICKHSNHRVWLPKRRSYCCLHHVDDAFKSLLVSPVSDPQGAATTMCAEPIKERFPTGYLKPGRGSRGSKHILLAKRGAIYDQKRASVLVRCSVCGGLDRRLQIGGVYVREV